MKAGGAGAWGIVYAGRAGGAGAAGTEYCLDSGVELLLLSAAAAAAPGPVDDLLEYILDNVTEVGPYDD